MAWYVDYGHRDNDDLRERFNIKKEDYPHYKLFVKDRQEPVDFKGNPEKTEELKEFIIAETGLWIKAIGLIITHCKIDLDLLLSLCILF